MSEEKKPVLLLLPDTYGSINRSDYLNACIGAVMKEGYMPLTPAAYTGTPVKNDEFVCSVIQKVSGVFLFVDFGIDVYMLEVMERAVEFTTVHFRRLPKEKVEQLSLTPEQILMDVCKKSKYRQEELASRTRKREIVDHRFVYFRRAKELTSATLEKIGEPVGLDHATVLWGIREAHETAQVVELYEKYYGKNSEL